MARNHARFDLPILGHIYDSISCSCVLDTLHDCVVHSHGTQVRLKMLVYPNDTDRRLRFVAWYLFGFSGCLSPILYSTVNTIVKNDAEERALILVSS